MKKSIFYLLCAASVVLMGCNKNDDAISIDNYVQPVSGTQNGYDFVDLGLFAYWATMNVGATNIEDCGNYYAWGEIETKKQYSWATYKYSGNAQSTITKYCLNSKYGQVDGLTTLEAGDDAALQVMGGKWRMPNDEELRQLIVYCKWQWSIINGVKGYLLTSTRNGNTLFLPAGGEYNNSSIKGVGSLGCYTSSAVSEEYNNQANGIMMRPSEAYYSTLKRCYGHTVRGVWSE